MKKSNLIIAVCIVAVCAFGWLTMGSDVVKKSSMYSDYVEEADLWVDERGLYQRAIKNYNLALNEKETEEVYLKMNEAYKLRYNEAPEDTIDEYIDFLENAVEVYPANQELVDSFVDMYYLEGKYEDIYDCLMNAISNGYDTPEIRAELRNARYAFKLKGNTFSGLKQSKGEYYSAQRNRGWNIYTVEDGYILTDEYEFVSRPNEDGIVIATGNDSRILDPTGMVYGIFKGKVTDASLYADNLIAACVDGVYSYYDDFADKQFGEYEMAGSFQNGQAAVKKDGKWMLIDTEGEVVSELFDEIVIDYEGNHFVNGLMLAKKNGAYELYDKKMKLLYQLNVSDADILTEDGIIALLIDGKWGFVNTECETVIEPAYEEARSFSNGLAAVKNIDDKWGFIDLEGNLVIDYQFSDVGYMNSDGICPVRTDFPEETTLPETEITSGENVVTPGDSDENTDSPAVSETDTSTDTVETKTDADVSAVENADVEPVEGENGADPEIPVEDEVIEVIESWKLLELEIGIKEDK